MMLAPTGTSDTLTKLNALAFTQFYFSCMYDLAISFFCAILLDDVKGMLKTM
jgi:hypothetical protein